jgi:hypothetical protein
MPSAFPHKTQIKTPDNSPAPTHLLMACIGCVRAVIMTYDPTIPMVHYRMTGCNYVTCHCVVKAFIGKTRDGRMAYFNFDFDDIDLKNETRKKILSGTDPQGNDTWTGQEPRAIEFWFDHYQEMQIMIQDYAMLTADPVFRRYFEGVNPQIVRLPLHPDLFATQDPEDILPLYVPIDKLRAIKDCHTPYVGDLRPETIGHSIYRSRADDVRINELSLARWRKWLLAGGSLAGDGLVSLAIYGRYYNPAHEDATYWVY